MVMRRRHTRNRAELLNVRVGEDLIDGINGAAGHSGGIQSLDPMHAAAGSQALLDCAIQRLAVVRARGLGEEMGIGEQLFGANRLA